MLFLELISEKYVRVLMKNHGMNFIDKIIEVGFGIASEDPEIYGEKEGTPPEFAINMLYSYACTVPNVKVYPIFEKYLQKFGTSQNEHERAAATRILGFIADSESCLDHVRDNCNALTNFVVEKMMDDSKWVREAAGETVGRFSEHVVPDFLDKHKKVMPALMKVTKDLADSKHDMTIQKSLFALNEFVQQLDYDIKFYIDQIIELLMVYIKGDYSRDVKYWALTTMTNTIGVSGKKIIPFMNPLLELFHSIIT